MPPNYDLDRTELHCWRIEPDGHARRYSFRAILRNSVFAGVLDCDDTAKLVQLQLIRTPPSKFGNLEPPTVSGTENVVVRLSNETGDTR